MKIYITAFLLSLGISVLLTPLVRRMALQIGAVSRPGGRNVHVRTVPRLGGIAIALAWVVPIVALFVYRPWELQFNGTEVDQLIGLILGGIALCCVGALDDARGMRAAHKLGFQVVAAAVAFAFGFRIEAVDLPLIGTLSMGAFAFPVTVFWIVGVTNAVNLIDGLDGLAAGVSFFAALTSFIIASLSGSTFVALAMATLMGSLVGFLFFNFNPARIFMGDSGSYFLGYILATAALAGTLQQKASTAVSLLVPVLALGVPIFDTVFSLLRRFVERRPLFMADRGHVHHRLLELGLTHRRAVMLLYGISVVLAGGAIVVSLGRSWQVGAALVSVSVVFFGLVRFLGGFAYLHFRRRQKARLRDPLTENLRRTVPSLVVSLSRAATEDEVFNDLGRIVKESPISYLQVTRSGRVVRSWGHDAGDETKRDLVEASFPLGRGEDVKLKFVWVGDSEGPSAQADVLLQILVDAACHALTAANSILIIAPAPVQESTSPASVVGAELPLT